MSDDLISREALLEKLEFRESVGEKMLINRLEFREKIEKSLRENVHGDPKIKQNHYMEHRHFLQMLDMEPTVYDTEEVIKQLKKYKWLMFPGVLKKIIAIVRKGGV